MCILEINTKEKRGEGYEVLGGEHITSLSRWLLRKHLKEVRDLSKQGRKFDNTGNSKSGGLVVAVCLEVQGQGH